MLFEEFFIPALANSHWRLGDSKSLQVSRTLLSILADLNNAVIWMISSCRLISKSPSRGTNPLVTIPRAPITIGITVTLVFHSFFSSVARSKFLSFFSLSFKFTLWSDWTAKSKIRQVLFFVYYHDVCQSCISKSKRSLWISFFRTYFGLCIYHLFIWSNFRF